MNPSNLLLELILKGDLMSNKKFFTRMQDGNIQVDLHKMIKNGYYQLALFMLSGDKDNLSSFCFINEFIAFELALKQKQDDLAFVIYTVLSSRAATEQHSWISYAIKNNYNRFLSKYIDYKSVYNEDKNKKITHIDEEGPAHSTLLECAVIYKNMEAMKLLATIEAGSEHPQFTCTDDNRRNALGVAGIMAVADAKNENILRTLLGIVMLWENYFAITDAFDWLLSQLNDYRCFGESRDENNFFRKESGKKEEEYSDYRYERIKSIVKEFRTKNIEKQKREIEMIGDHCRL